MIEKFALQDANSAEAALDESDFVKSDLHETEDWEARLATAGLQGQDGRRVGQWMNHVLGTDFTKPEQ